MHSNYSSIPNPNDLENQAHHNHHQHHHHDHHQHHHQHQNHQHQHHYIEVRRRKSGCCCCSFPCIVFILVTLILIALFQKHIKLIIRDGWNSKDVYYSCSNMDSPNIQWQGNSVYYAPQNINELQIIEINEKYGLHLDSGKVKIIENKNLTQTKITFDFKISNNLLQDGVLINEKQNGDKLELAIVHVKDRFNGCVKINTLIEVPSASSSFPLNRIKLGYMNNEIRIKDTLTLNQDLTLDVVNGDVIIESPIKTKTMDVAIVNGDLHIEAPTTISSSVKLAIVNGDIKGQFHLNQSKLDASIANGVIDLQFGTISPVSTITTSIINGKTDIRVPSNFDSSYKLVATVGKTDIGGLYPENLHYHRSTHIVGETIEGYYGDKENNQSKIDASTVNGDISLHYI